MDCGTFSTALGALAIMTWNWTWSTFWTMLGALATWVAVVGIFYAGRQLRLNAWCEVQKIFTDEKFAKARGRVFRHLREPGKHAWDTEDNEKALDVCRWMDSVCHLAPYLSFSSFLGKRIFLKIFDDPLGKSWALLKPLVKAEQEHTGFDNKWMEFERLGERAFARVNGRLSEPERKNLDEAAKHLSSEIPQFRKQLESSRNADKRIVNAPLQSRC